MERNGYADHRFGQSPPLSIGVEDYTYLRWDVRPHPKLGTVEVRAMAVQRRAEARGVAALVQALAAKEIDRPRGPGLHRGAGGALRR